MVEGIFFAFLQGKDSNGNKKNLKAVFDDMCKYSTEIVTKAKGKVVSESEMKPGDLIFYSYTNNGRYKNISHMGIYVGDGKMVEAMNEDNGVVYGNYHNGSLVMIGRPVKK